MASFFTLLLLLLLLLLLVLEDVEGRGTKAAGLSPSLLLLSMLRCREFLRRRTAWDVGAGAMTGGGVVSVGPEDRRTHTHNNKNVSDNLTMRYNK